MKIKPSIIILSFCFIIIFSLYYSCDKISSGTPKCVKEIIRNEKKSGDCLDKVYKYNYNGKEVYWFVYNQNCADACWSLIDENCNTLIDTSGNVICNCTGGMVINCSDFSQNRTNETLIWQK